MLNISKKDSDWCLGWVVREPIKLVLLRTRQQQCRQQIMGFASSKNQILKDQALKVCETAINEQFESIW